MNPNLHMFIIIVLAFSIITVEENLPNIVIKKIIIVTTFLVSENAELKNEQ